MSVLKSKNGNTWERVPSVKVLDGSSPTGTKQILVNQNGITTENVFGYANAEIITSLPGPSWTEVTVISDVQYLQHFIYLYMPEPAGDSALLEGRIFIRKPPYYQDPGFTLDAIWSLIVQNKGGDNYMAGPYNYCCTYFDSSQADMVQRVISYGGSYENSGSLTPGNAWAGDVYYMSDPFYPM